jgi:ferredoxin-NADP reductase
MAEGVLKTKIVLREIIRETSEIYSFVFEIPKDLEWVPGQHGIFRYAERDIAEDKGFRIFSLASVKEEGILMFSTRITGESTDFKQQLLTIKPGEVMTVEGINGKFKFEDYGRKACVMAGGIGITPVRALLMQLEQSGVEPEGISILYSDDRGEFAYEETLKALGEKISNLKVLLISDRSEFVDEIDGYAKANGNSSVYMISGTPGMNTFITDKLVNSGIDKTNIKTDIFMGYQ